MVGSGEDVELLLYWSSSSQQKKQRYTTTIATDTRKNTVKLDGRKKGCSLRGSVSGTAGKDLNPTHGSGASGKALCLTMNANANQKEKREKPSEAIYL